MIRPHTLVILLSSAVACLFAGCNWEDLTGSTNQAPRAPATARRVEMVNLTTRTRAANPSVLTVDQFFTRATQAFQEGKLGRLGRLVARYPDVALEMLRSTDPRQAGTPERQAVASAYDRLFVEAASAESRGWNWTLRQMASRADALLAFNVRIQAKGLIEQGRFNMAAKAAESSAAGRDFPPLLGAESLRLRGVALLLDNHSTDAAAAWRQARELAPFDGCVAAELDLLMSDALRRAGQNAEAASAWNGAARLAVRLRDPILWERLVELRPADAVWPGEVQTDIQHQVTTQPEQAATEAAGAGGFDQGFVWRQIAEWRLERNETTAALLAFSRAETESQSAWLKGEARIGQARTLLAMNQDAPAMAILNAQAQSPEPSVSCHALAVLGVATFQKGRTDDGIALLVRAVVNPDGIRWSGYSQAQADLALAYLTVGEEDQGLRLLHEAQDAFAREGRIADLSQCLVNEVAYLKKPGAKSPDRARAILRRIEQLDASPG